MIPELSTENMLVSFDAILVFWVETHFLTNIATSFDIAAHAHKIEIHLIFTILMGARKQVKLNTYMYIHNKMRLLNSTITFDHSIVE